MQNDRQKQQDKNREDRQQQQNKNREDWQEHNEDFYEEGGGAYWHGGVWVGDWDEVHVVHYDEHEGSDWGALVAGFAIGTALTAATFQGATTKAGCTMSDVSVEGISYYHCGTTWYTRVMQGGEVTYIVVSPPPGF